jgi:hypothetical protein
MQGDIQWLNNAGRFSTSMVDGFTGHESALGRYGAVYATA